MKKFIGSLIGYVLYIGGSLYTTAGFIVVALAFPGLSVVTHVLLYAVAVVAVYVGFQGFDVTILKVEKLLTGTRIPAVLTSVFLAVFGLYFLASIPGTGTNLIEDVALIQVGTLFIAGSVLVWHSESSRFNA